VVDNLLFLSAYLPSPVAAQAGQKTAFRHLEWCARSFNVWLLAFRNEADRIEDEERLRQMCCGVAVIPVSRMTRLTGWLSRPDLPLLVGARWSGSARTVVRRWASQHGFKRMHAEWSQMAEYFSSAPDEVERRVSAHDVVTDFCERAAASETGLKRSLWRFEAGRARRWEIRQYARCRSVVVQSTRDAATLRTQLGGRVDVRVVPPYFERHPARLRDRSAKGPTLLFWGALSRTENSDAALWLGREFFPMLRARLPGARLILGGSKPSETLRALAGRGIEVPGFVEDPSPLFAAADAAVLPLRRGAGIKVKVLECLAAGIPVLTTEIGAEGIPATAADGLRVAEPDVTTWIDEITSLWTKPGLLKGLSEGALRWGSTQGNATPGVFDL
jgi:polysaccharide biosynthesis protein PslH